MRLFKRNKAREVIEPDDVQQELITKTLDYIAKLTIDGYLPLDIPLAKNVKGEVLSLGLDNSRLEYVIEKDSDRTGSVERRVRRTGEVGYIISGGLYGEGNGPITETCFPNFNPYAVLTIANKYYSPTKKHKQEFTLDMIREFKDVLSH